MTPKPARAAPRRAREAGSGTTALSLRLVWRIAGPSQHSPYASWIFWAAVHVPVLVVDGVGPGALIMVPFTLPISCTPSSCVIEAGFGDVARKPGAFWKRK